MDAIKYGDGQPIEVTAVKTGDVARITVADNGIGIREENAAAHGWRGPDSPDAARSAAGVHAGGGAVRTEPRRGELQVPVSARLTKPVDLDHLLDAVHRVAAGRVPAVLGHCGPWPRGATGARGGRVARSRRHGMSWAAAGVVRACRPQA